MQVLPLLFSSMQILNPSDGFNVAYIAKISLGGSKVRMTQQ